MRGEGHTAQCRASLKEAPAKPLVTFSGIRAHQADAVVPRRRKRTVHTHAVPASNHWEEHVWQKHGRWRRRGWSADFCGAPLLGPGECFGVSSLTSSGEERLSLAGALCGLTLGLGRARGGLWVRWGQPRGADEAALQCGAWAYLLPQRDVEAQRVERKRMERLSGRQWTAD